MIKNYLKTMALALGLLGWSATTNAQNLLSEDFSSCVGTTPPPSWVDNDIAGSGFFWHFDNPGGRTLNSPISAPFAGFDSDFYGGNAGEESALESIAFDASSVTGSIFLSFDHFFDGGFGGEYHVEVFDGTTWTEVLSDVSGGTTNNPDHQSVDITTATGGSTVAQVRFRWVGDWSYYWFVDNVSVDVISCPALTALTAFNLAGFSTDLTWTENGSATSWQIEYDTLGFTQGAGTLSVVGNDTTTISSLTPETDYEFYVRAICGAGDSSVWVGPIAFTTTPSCPASTALNFTNSTATTTDLTWTQTGSPASWQMEYGATGFTQGAGTISIESNDTVTVATTPNTAYEFYVRAICGAGDTSTWTGPFSFTTPCTATNVPYTQDFELATTPNMPSCTSIENAGTGNDWETGFTTNSGFNSIVLEYTYNSSNPANAWFYTQGINLTAGTNYQITYDYGDLSYVEKLKVAYGTSPSSVSMTNLIADHTTAGTETLASNLATFIPATTGVYYFGFNAHSIANQNQLYVDNIVIDVAPACPAPTALNFTNPIATTTDLTWTEAGSAASWQMEYGTTGFTQGTGTISIESNDTVTVATTLNADYDFYVRAICGAGDTSTWVGPFTFHTGYCVSIPTSHDNNGISNIMVGTTNFAGSSIEYLDFTGGTIVDLAQGVQANLQITFETGYNYDANVWIDLNDNFVFESTELAFSGTSTNSNPTTLDASFPMLATAPLGNHYMRIGSADGGQAPPDPCYSGSYGVTADFIINVIAAPACLPVTALTATNIYSDSAQIGWTAGGTETAWNIEWGTPGFAPGTGAELGAASYPTTSYMITGLTPNTSYDVYVQANCGTDSSMWVGPITVFTGYCNPTNTYSTSYYISGVSTTGAVQNLNNTGTGFGTNGYTNYANTDTLIVYPGQQINFTLSHPSSTYGYTAWVDWNHNLDFSDAGDEILSTGYESTPYTISYTVPLTASLATTVLRIRNAFVSNPAPACGSFDYGEAEDYAIKIIAVPSCMPITGLNVDSTTQDSISVSWTAGGLETNWNIEWGAPGYTPGTGTEIGSATSVTTMYHITGLNASTAYDIYVQANCGGGDSSYWTLVQGTTLCAAITTLPWTENFDAMASVGAGFFPNCWLDETGGWETGALGANNYLLAFEYDYNDVIWTPEFSLTAGESYEFSFMANGSGQSNWNSYVLVSPEQASSSAVTLDTMITASETSENGYVKYKYCFTPDSTGSYYFGIKVSDNNYVDDYFFDNFMLQIPSQSIGTDGNITVCQTGGNVDLNAVVTITNTEGSWMFAPNPTAIVSDTLFNPNFIAAGATEVYYYTSTGCYPDTITATINIYPPSSAGTDGTDTTCNYGFYNLYNALTGSADLGGQWYDPASQPINGSSVNFSGNIPASYNYIYIASNGVCPADTAIVEIVLTQCAGVDEYSLQGFNFYPNPTNGVVNIQYSGKGEDVQIDIIDTKGAVVWTKQVLFNDGSAQKIDLTRFENGTYYINMRSKNGAKVMKVVKN